MMIGRSLAVVLVISVWSCDQDPFHMRERTVLSGYELQQWENSTTYYLVKSGEKDNGGGVLDGAVLRIGWNGRYVIAERKANFGGDKDGWMIVDTATKKITGPFSDSELKARPEVRQIAIMNASEAWRRLH